MNPAIPAVEITHHADALRVRRPHREIDTRFLANLPNVRAKFLIQLPMLTFAEKVHVHLAHYDAIGIWVACGLFAAVTALDAQSVANVTLHSHKSRLKKA